jgi:hypothetical protein
MRTRFIFPLVLYGSIYSTLHFVLTLLIGSLALERVHRIFLLPLAWAQEPLWNDGVVPLLGRSQFGRALLDRSMFADVAFGGALLGNSALCGFFLTACFLLLRQRLRYTKRSNHSLSLSR